MPGERVNRPDFGCGLLQLVFAPNSAELAATLQALVQGALQQWLGDLIRVEEVARRERATRRSRCRSATPCSRRRRVAAPSFTQKVTVMSGAVRLPGTRPRRRAARCGAGEPAAAAERHRVPRGRAGPAPARSALRASARPRAGRAADDRQRRDPRRRARARSAGHRRSAGSGDVLSVEVATRRRLLDLHAAAGRDRRRRGAARGHRPGARADRVQLQGRLPERLRLPPATRLPARRRAPARRSTTWRATTRASAA